MAGELVFLTGATGFVGGHVARALLEAGYRVRVLVRDPAGSLPDGCEPVVGDLRRAGELVPGLRGCRFLVHVAAHYSFAPREARAIWETNVLGCAGLLEAARVAGVEKAVVTSSSAAVGPATVRGPATEDDRALLGHGRGYHASKVEQEVVALAAQVPVVLVLPTAPVGPGDGRPTPTGKIVLDFVRGGLPATVRGGMNLVPVEDVARGHVLALERGRPGERYVLGGEDLTFDDLFGRLARLTGRRPPRRHLPHPLVLAVARADNLRCRLLGAEPAVPLEGAEMARLEMYASSAKANEELGWRPGPVTGALERAVAWYRAA
ncbi:MAG: NAD-dependent epimerase/dehydratase family protein [Candidatus Dormibacteraeota bacterium]|nr:NAD-dependent epimerase/dehydratase family protein [Candidatus Dormibacteraeota bacterium]MBO0761441.1 NAD-dependent epimerase/dehydratase family protein [Candidatus Dormibacteraeota bacterium]